MYHIYSFLYDILDPIVIKLEDKIINYYFDKDEKKYQKKRRDKKRN